MPDSVVTKALNYHTNNIQLFCRYVNMRSIQGALNNSKSHL